VPPPQSADDLAQWLETTYDRIQPYAERSAELNPPDQFDSLHDRAVALRERDRAETDRVIKDLRSSDDPRKVFERELRADHTEQELARVYRALELKRCVDLITPPAGDGAGESRAPTADGCRGIEATGRELRGDVSSAASEVRAERRTAEGLEEEVRVHPEDQAKIEPDVSSSRRTLKENQRELGKARRELKSLEADARRAGCAVPSEPPPINAAACREIDQDSRELRGEIRSAAEEVRAEQTTIDELETEIREYPEDRAETEPDLKDSKRALKDIRGELAADRRGLRSAHADARRERCTR
jgi:DNA repair exonuclease SbcCD ATPase subunit